MDPWKGFTKIESKYLLFSKNKTKYTKNGTKIQRKI